MPNFGGGELLVVLIIVLVIFGGAKIPQLARSLGTAQREFRKGSEEAVDEDDRHPKGSKPST
jgi:sec-independent protein translocase protein TatA